MGVTQRVERESRRFPILWIGKPIHYSLLIDCVTNFWMRRIHASIQNRNSYPLLPLFSVLIDNNVNGVGQVVKPVIG